MTFGWIVKKIVLASFFKINITLTYLKTKKTIY